MVNGNVINYKYIVNELKPHYPNLNDYEIALGCFYKIENFIYNRTSFLGGFAVVFIENEGIPDGVNENCNIITEADFNKHILDICYKLIEQIEFNRVVYREMTYVFFEDDFKKIKSRITEVFSDFIENIIKIMYVDFILKKGHRITCRTDENTFIYTVDEEQRMEETLEFDITNNVERYFKRLEKNNIFLSGRAKFNTIIEYFKRRYYRDDLYEPDEYDYKNCEKLLLGYDTKASKTKTLFEALYGCIDRSFGNIQLPNMERRHDFYIIQHNDREPKYILYSLMYKQS